MRLVEKYIPLAEINCMAKIEMSGRMISKEFLEEFTRIFRITPRYSIPPRINNIHYWPARRPTVPSRFLTLYTFLSADFTDEQKIKKALGVEILMERIKMQERISPIIYMVKPDIKTVREIVSKQNAVVVDPMAGGGAIPLESLRLGFRTIIGDLNPLAYLLLKATIEYPARYGSELFKRTLDEAKRLINWAKSEFSSIFPQNGGRCTIFLRLYRHQCNSLIPIFHSQKLSKTRKFYFVLDDDNRIVRVNLESGIELQKGICPFCKMPYNEHSAMSKWVEKHKTLIDKILSPPIDEDALYEMLTETYLPIAIQVSKSKYLDASEEPQYYYKAVKALANYVSELSSAGLLLDELIPMNKIPRQNEFFNKVIEQGITSWHYLLSPRQLYVFLKLIHYVRQRIETLMYSDKEFGVAVGLYLALGISKYLAYNTMLSSWNASEGVARDLPAFKRASLKPDFVEIYPHIFSLPWVFEIDVAESGKSYLTRGGILPVLKHLCENLQGLNDRVKIYLWDARKLSYALPKHSIDLIHVDPPYLEQQDYSGISEFFWVFLRRMLLPAIMQGYLFRNDEVKVSGWSPLSDEAPRDKEIPEASVIVRSNGKRTAELFWKGMNEFFKSAYDVLKDDGYFLIWFTHSSNDAWENLFRYLYLNGFIAAKTWQIWSESPQRMVSNFVSSFFTSMVIVAKKGKRETILTPDAEAFIRAVDNAVRDSLETTWSIYDGLTREAVVMALADGQAVATKFELAGQIPEFSFSMLFDNATRYAIESLLRHVASKYGIERLYEEYVSTADVDSILYLLALLTMPEGMPFVPHDFFEKVKKIIRAKGFLLKKKSIKIYEVPIGRALIEYAGVRKHRHTAIRATELILMAVKDVPRLGSKRFADVIVNEGSFSKTDVAYALFMLKILKQSFLNILGVTPLIKDSIIDSLEEIIRRM